MKQKLMVVGLVLAASALAVVGVGAALDKNPQPPEEKAALEQLETGVGRGEIDARVFEWLSSAGGTSTFDSNIVQTILARLSAEQVVVFQDELAAASARATSANEKIARLWEPYDRGYQQANESGRTGIIVAFVKADPDALAALMDDANAVGDLLNTYAGKS